MAFQADAFQVDAFQQSSAVATGHHYYRHLRRDNMTFFTLSEATAARRRFPLYLVDATDGLTAETGEAAGQPQISKNGAAFANTTATLTSVGSGGYYVELTATELNTLGGITVRYKSANTAEFQGIARVTNADLFGTIAPPRLMPQTLYKLSEGSSARTRYFFHAVSNIGVPRTGIAGNVTLNGRVPAGAGPVTEALAVTELSAANNPGVYFINVSAWVSALGYGCFTIYGAIGGGLDFTDITQPYQVVAYDPYDATLLGLTSVATTTGVAVLQADTDDIQSRLPAVLVAGRMDSSVGAMAANTMTAAATAADYVTELQAGLATAAALDLVDNFIDTEIADLQARLPAALVSGRMDSSVGAMAASVLTATAIATDAITAAKIADAAIDLATFAVDARSNLFGFILNGTAQAGAATTITLHAGASAVDNTYVGSLLLITGGTGASQSATITGYVGATRVATVSAGLSGAGWLLAQPDATSTFAIFGENVRVSALGANVITSSVMAANSIGSAQLAANAITAAQIASNTITAAKIATDAIGAAQLAADAVTEIQSGLSTAAALSTVQADTDDIQTRLPAALVGGRMDSSTGAMAANVITTASTDPLYIIEVQAGLATAAALATVQADTDDIQTRIPAALVSGRMDSSVGAMAANVLTAAAAAADFGTEMAGVVWNSLTATYVTAGTMGLALGTVTATAVRDAVLSYEYRTGRTVRGLFRRLGAAIEGKATGLLSSTATFYQPNGSTVEFTAVQSVAGGTRETATVTNSEVP